MKKLVLVLTAFAVCSVSLLSPVAAELGDQLRARLGAGRPAGAPAGEDMAYGRDPLQRLDFWRASTGQAAAPLVVFVHGGGWRRGDKGSATGSAKVSHFLAAGYAVASVNYRLVPASTVEQQAADVAHAVAMLVTHSRALGIDPHRVVVMGHSAGAHLAALIGTDMHYLAQAGLRRDAIRGVILLDGAAYDVPRQIAEGPGLMNPVYRQAFGSDPARQRALSPTFQAARPNAAGFLILHVDRASAKDQSDALGAALRAAGTPAQVQAIAGTGMRGHMQINRNLGEPDYPATPIVDAYLRQLFGA